MLRTREHRRRAIAIVGACAAALLASGASAVSAEAYDHYPCGPLTTNKRAERVQYCHVWTSGVPVFKDPNVRSLEEARDANAIVGWLTHGGCTNWFYFQQRERVFATYYDRGYYNSWWAYTKADNGATGWVSEVYFTGGGNMELDGGLWVRWAGIPVRTAPRCGDWVA